MKLINLVLALFCGLYSISSANASSLRKVNYASRAPPAVAVLHGMGSSCLDSGMVRITEVVTSTMQSSYVKCIMIGDTMEEDVLNTFVLTMNEQVDAFAEIVKNSLSFADGFNAIGFSQGTLLIRGYVQKYAWRDDYPDVFAFMSVHGPLMGVGTVPYCDPNWIFAPDAICETIAGITGDIAYSRFIQNNIAQANYLRDPLYIEDYLTTKFLPYLNGETESDDYQGLEDLKQVVLVKALKDKVVVPVDSEWMGFFKDGSLEEEDIEQYNETIFYEDDMFGLRTLDEAGKLFFETTPNGHVEITSDELTALLNKYWLPNYKWENKVIIG